VIIQGKVYDVTGYVDEHPGGDAILRNAGCVPGSSFERLVLTLSAQA
jgi:cytochrome b involved in lipid metabolism